MESTQEETAKDIGRAVKPQSVLVIGSGAVGCLYGGRLSEAGHAVTFLMRRDLEAARQKVRRRPDRRPAHACL
jgi:pyruvate/2-oxoglutarate dehydrogenase complex dihydrolipoamide dehydrogenase (E3) component